MKIPYDRSAMKLLFLLTLASMFYTGAALAGDWGSLCERELVPMQASYIRINSDGTEERSDQEQSDKERIEEDRRREEEEYWRRRQPMIERREDIEKQRKREPIPGIDFPVSEPPKSQDTPAVPSKPEYRNWAQF